jgi:hypothetical protein
VLGRTYKGASNMNLTLVFPGVEIMNFILSMI